MNPCPYCGYARFISLPCPDCGYGRELNYPQTPAAKKQDSIPDTLPASQPLDLALWVQEIEQILKQHNIKVRTDWDSNKGQVLSVADYTLGRSKTWPLSYWTKLSAAQVAHDLIVYWSDVRVQHGCPPIP